MGDVDQPVVLSPRGGALRVFIGQVKCGPESAVGLAITQERNFLGRHRGQAERVEQKDQLAMPAATDEGIEVPRTLLRIEISDCAKINVFMQFLTLRFY